MTTNITNIARDFFDACDTGEGWDSCKGYCTDNAAFSCQAAALADVTTVAAYTDWMKGLFDPIPDGHYKLKAFAADPERNTVVVAAEFHGTHTGEGGPVPPTGKKIATDYVYTLEFDGDKIHRMTKIWNDAHSMKQLDWA